MPRSASSSYWRGTFIESQVGWGDLPKRQLNTPGFAITRENNPDSGRVGAPFALTSLVKSTTRSSELRRMDQEVFRFITQEIGLKGPYKSIKIQQKTLFSHLPVNSEHRRECQGKPNSVMQLVPPPKKSSIGVEQWVSDKPTKMNRKRDCAL